MGAWLNLHHTLHELGVKKSGPEAWSAPGIEAVDGVGLAPNDAAAWSAAVEAYRATLSAKDPVMDRDLAALHRELAERGSLPDLAGC